jgi:hypothetical protein
VEKGVRQGGVLSPFLWVAFTDALLAAQRKVGPGVRVGTVEGHVVRVAGSCYMDDAVWYAEGAEEMQRRVEVQSVFCRYHGIKMNLDKSTYTHVPGRREKSKEAPPPPQIEGVAAKVGYVDSYYKYLGVHVNVRGEVKHEVGKIKGEVMAVYDAIERQRMTVAEARYVINTVVAGKLQYAMQAVGLPRAFLHQVDNRSARLIKLKAGVGVTCPRYLVFLPCASMGLGVTCFTDMQDAITITEQIIRLNSDTLAGEVARARLMSEKEAQGVLSCPYDKEAMEEAEVRRFGGGLVRYTQRCLQMRGMEVRTSDVSMHRRCLESVHMSMVMRRSNSLDWSLLAQRLKGRVWVTDWAEERREGWRVREYEEISQGGVGGVPSQIYCMVRHMLTGGGEVELRGGEVLDAYCWDGEKDVAHMERVLASKEGETAMEANRGQGQVVEAATDGSKMPAEEEVPASVGAGWCARVKSEEEVDADVMRSMGSCWGLDPSASNNVAEMDALSGLMMAHHVSAELEVQIDSMYVISGVQKPKPTIRKQVRANNRAEWGKLRSILRRREGHTRVSHVRSHARDEEGELVQWGDMSKPQKLNSVADGLADAGREQWEGEVGGGYEFPQGELQYALFDKGRRVTGDPRRHISKGKGKWVRERAERWREGSTGKVAEGAGVWCHRYHQVMEGKRGYQLQRHLCRLTTEMYKTSQWWFKRYPQEFGHLRGAAEIEEGGLVGGLRYHSMMCTQCGEKEETMRHMFGECQGESDDGKMGELRERLNLRSQELVEGVLRRWGVRWEGWVRGGDRVGDMRHGLWSFMMGVGEGLVEAAWWSKVEVQVQKQRGFPEWMRYAGLLPSGLKVMLMTWVNLGGRGAASEVCEFELGAKMGIGKNRKCKCVKCCRREAVDGCLQKLIDEHLSTGLELWETRCESWGDWCEMTGFKVPWSRGGGGTPSGEVVPAEAQLCEEEWEEAEESGSEEGEREGKGWVMKVGEKRKLREEELAEAALRVREICGYGMGKGKKEREVARGRELRGTRDIREVMGGGGREGEEEEDLGEEGQEGGSDREQGEETQGGYFSHVGGGVEGGSSADAEAEAAEEERDMVAQLRVRWDWMEAGWQAKIRDRAKIRRVDKCGHLGHRKQCDGCRRERIRAHREWEEDNPRKVRRLLESKTHVQTSIR